MQLEQSEVIEYDRETGSWLEVSSERLENSGMEPMTPGLQCKRLNHQATEASTLKSVTNEP